MGLIKNFNQLATDEPRKVVLELVEAGLAAILPSQVLDDQISCINGQLEISGRKFNLTNFERVFLLGFGKGSGGVVKIVSEKLGEKISQGWVIDVAEEIESELSNKIKRFSGTHPLPTEQNVDFTKNVVLELEGKLTDKDLVMVVICGGGSAMLTLPKFSVEQLIEVNKALLRSGATISEMNCVRKKLDLVKGGGLAKILFPATVASLIFSDVPGNELSVIASGPTVVDPTTTADAKKILEKFEILDKLKIKDEDLMETPKEEKYFKNVANILMLSNLTAIQAMGRRAQELGFQVTVHSDRVQGEARDVGIKLVKMIAQSGKHQIILAGGETTVTVLGNGKGGRNLELVLGALKELMEGTTMGVNQLESLRPHNGKELGANVSDLEGVVVCSFDSDGWDNCSFAGAIIDESSKYKVQTLKLNVDDYLKNNDAGEFFKKTEDGIDTGRLPCNVSDLMIVLKN